MKNEPTHDVTTDDAAAFQQKVEEAEAIFGIKKLLALAKQIPGSTDHYESTNGSFASRTDDGGPVVGFRISTGQWFILYVFPTHGAVNLQLANGSMPYALDSSPIKDVAALLNATTGTTTARTSADTHWSVLFEPVDFSAL